MTIESCTPATPAEGMRLIAWLLYESAVQSQFHRPYIRGLADGVLELADSYARNETLTDKDATIIGADAHNTTFNTREIGDGYTLALGRKLIAELEADGFRITRVYR